VNDCRKEEGKGKETLKLYARIEMLLLSYGVRKQKKKKKKKKNRNVTQVDKAVECVPSQATACL
jgi:hypothetical protein